MRKSFYLALALCLALVGTAVAQDTIWQIGTPNGPVNPIAGAAEFPANRAWVSSFTYVVGTDTDPINAPTARGYIGPTNVCDIADDGRACTDTAQTQVIQFSLDCDYEGVVLFYDRYGSEKDKLYLDGTEFAETTPPGEGNFAQFQYLLGQLSAGIHTIAIEYAGGGSNNGHYIDYLKLVGTESCPTSCEDLSQFGIVTTVDFEGLATAAGSAGAVNLSDPYSGFAGLTMTRGTATGLWVGEPINDGSDNCTSFYGNDFFAVSGSGVFSPENCGQGDTGSPVGSVIVDFLNPVSAVGLYFLDPEGATSSIKAFDGPQGGGNAVDLATAQGLPDNSQAFRQVSQATDSIKSVVIQLGGGGDGVGMDDLCFAAEWRPIVIDIKPGSDPNCFNINGHGVVPVAVMGTADFDVTTIDVNTIVFAGLEVRVRGNRGPLCHYEDWNYDGYTDLVCQFEDDPAAWDPGTADACLEGYLLPEFGGYKVKGCDAICVVP